MAQTAERQVIRRNIRLAGKKHLVFDHDGNFWRVALWVPYRSSEQVRPQRGELVRDMVKAGMLERLDSGNWWRTAIKHEDLEMAISAALLNANFPYLTRDILDYIKSTEWSWYLNG